MKVKQYKLDSLNYALQLISCDDLPGINIYCMNDNFEARKANAALEYGVNWCACGTVSVSESEQFAKNLTKAAKIAKILSDLNIESSDRIFNTDITKEQYLEEVKTVKNLLLTSDINFVNTSYFIKMWFEKEVQV